MTKYHKRYALTSNRVLLYRGRVEDRESGTGTKILTIRQEPCKGWGWGTFIAKEKDIMKL